MRLGRLVIYTMIILGLHSCSPKFPSSGEVNFLIKESPETIGVKSIGYGKNREEAILEAQKNAFLVILFKGLPGTENAVPLIANEVDAKVHHQEYLSNFFEKSHFKAFMMRSTESSNLIKVKGGRKISVDLKINLNSLRRDLEQNNIIRKFGF